MQANELLDIIRGRRSIRRFAADPVTDEQLEPLLEAMQWAPSAGNAQPWRVHVVRDRERKELLAQAALGQRFVAEAPVALVVVADLDEAIRAYGKRGAELYVLQDTAAAVQNLLLAAHAAGLGACWVGAFRESMVSRALSLPEMARPVAVVPVGVPAETPAPPRRKPLTQLVVK
jgi:nitroreductase